MQYIILDSFQVIKIHQIYFLCRFRSVFHLVSCPLWIQGWAEVQSLGTSAFSPSLWWESSPPSARPQCYWHSTATDHMSPSVSNIKSPAVLKALSSWAPPSEVEDLLSIFSGFDLWTMWPAGSLWNLKYRMNSGRQWYVICS